VPAGDRRVARVHCGEGLRLSFLRKKPDVKAAAARADWAIKKVYGYGAITLALTRIDTYWAFNKSTPLTIDTHVPLTHRREPLKAYGVVDEIGQFDTRIMVDVEFTDYADKAGIGHCFLERKKIGLPTLRVILRDRRRRHRSSHDRGVEGSGDLGQLVSAFRADHREVGQRRRGDQADRRARIRAPLTITGMASVRKVLLHKAPPDTWRREFD